MKSGLKLLFFIIALSPAFCLGQQTVFVTEEGSNEKEPKIKKHIFSQIGFSIPIQSNPNFGKYYGTKRDDNRLIPDGVCLNVGLGMHYRKWVGVSINTGIDWRIKHKLVSAPVYGSVMFNPQIGYTGIYAEYGLGTAFALGRWDLSGLYQKYKLGLILDNEICIFIDLSRYGYPLHGYSEIGSFSIGMSILSLE